MRLLMHELITTLDQRILIKENNLRVSAIRPWIYSTGTQSGSLKVQIKNSDREVIKESSLISINDIHAEFPNQYIHSLVKFDITFDFRKGQNYYIGLATSGYTFSSSSFVGWLMDYDLKIVNRTFIPSSNYVTPFLIEMWENKEYSKGNP